MWTGVFFLAGFWDFLVFQYGFPSRRRGIFRDSRDFVFWGFVECSGSPSRYFTACTNEKTILSVIGVSQTISAV